jgi:hypothetical protein
MGHWQVAKCSSGGSVVNCNIGVAFQPGAGYRPLGAHEQMLSSAPVSVLTTTNRRHARNGSATGFDSSAIAPITIGVAGLRASAAIAWRRLCPGRPAALQTAHNDANRRRCAPFEDDSFSGHRRHRTKKRRLIGEFRRGLIAQPREEQMREAIQPFCASPHVAFRFPDFLQLRGVESSFRLLAPDKVGGTVIASGPAPAPSVLSFLQPANATAATATR